MDKEIILQVKDLHVRLDSQEILKHVSFTVKKGEALAVIGPNGAGKTVLFRALLGLIPYSGEVAWKNGVTLGYVPQKLYIEPSTPLTVKEFFALKSKRFWFPAKSFSSHLNHELQLVGLPEKVLKKTVGALSGGEQQRLMIAWAMLNHPDVLLFDEPTSGIDAGFEETVYTIMERVQKERGTTVLIISHDLNVVYHYANDVLCLNHKVVCQGHPSDVLNSRDLAKLYGESSFYHHAINHSK